ncbi:podocalyxin [Lepus europaeus]|uniref:podocalyxin n=1 Tax=Lepus europaeus TaxID=9983 RepID=UPI002B49C08C|nr:podocalyxin [Lepus europaeus]
MRSALALAALLLLLSPPSLSQENSAQPSTAPTTTTQTSVSTRPTPASAPAPKSSVAASVPAEQPTAPMTTKAPATRSPSASPGSSVETSAPAQGSATTEQSLSIPTKAEAKDAGGVTTAHVTGSVQPVTSGSQVAAQDPAASEAPSSHSITTKSLTTEAMSQAPRQTTDLGTTGPTAPPVTNSASPDLLSHATAKPSKGPQLSFPTSASSLGPGTGTLSTPQGKPATLTPVASSAETQGMPSSMPPSPASPSPSPSSPSPALQPSGPSAGTEDTTGRGPTSSSTELASTALHSPSTSPPTSAVRDHRVSCGPPERLTEQLLILNLTRNSPCIHLFQRQSQGEGETDLHALESLPEDKLVTLLCRAAKPTFNPAQDQCHVLLAPVLGSHAVVVKEITVKTNLLPTAVFELLKDRWDDLREEGVSDMQLGDQGPPEETEDRFSLPLIITIVCMASFLLLVAALYGCCHQRLSHRKDQQRLTEELQTVENGYHDNPTLEVMETSAEMQEKKVVNLNGELGDSWIVPLDNLTKDDLDEEEDTHL